MRKLFNLLIANGGKIVPSNECSDLEIAQARACGRMYVDKDGFGFIYFPKN